MATAITDVATRRRGRTAKGAKRPTLKAVKAAEKAMQPPDVDEETRKFSDCRALGHSWRHKGAVGPEKEPPLAMYNAVGALSICSDCKAERIKWIGRYGSRGQTTYHYPKGYARHGEQILTPTEWRHTWIVKALGAA